MILPPSAIRFAASWPLPVVVLHAGYGTLCTAELMVKHQVFYLEADGSSRLDG
jgi:hypothetical protein